MGFFDLFRKKDKSKSKKYKMGLHKTREGALSSLSEILKESNKVDDNLFDRLEEIFIMADIGVDTVIDFIDDLKDECYHKKITEPTELQEIILDKMFEIYLNGEIVNANLDLNKDGLSVILFVGVNGVGKTTTVGKLAGKFKAEGKKVVIAGADTFRAAAGDQLKEWANRSGVDMIGGTEGADPGSVVYDAVAAAKARNADVLLVDTAGRLHNKKNLMNELGKINRIIEKEYAGVFKETLVVLDATTGQNALAQAKEFSEVANITGIVLTKMDGTAKGGIAVAIQSELSVPVKYIGVGETIDDLQKFDANEFIDALFDVNEDQ